MEKTIKVNGETYKRLNELVGAMRAEKGRPVSINEALSEVLEKERKGNIMDFAGVWSYKSDAEIRKLKKEIRDVWKLWKR